MKKILLALTLVLLIVAAPVFADPVGLSSVTIASLVKELVKVSPSITISFSPANITGYTTLPTGGDSAVITGLDLSKDGSFSFQLMTSQEVNVTNGSQRASVDIEITVDGFHLYDLESAGDVAMNEDALIKKRYAVPIASGSPDIDIPQFSGANENVSVHTAGSGNKVEVTFNQGVTKSDLVLGTFTVEWKGIENLEAGIYKAKVSVQYGSP